MKNKSDEDELMIQCKSEPEFLDMSLGKFLVVKTLTSDEASEIKFVRNLETGEEFAAKVFQPLHLEDFLREARALERVKGNRNIIQLRGKESSHGKNYLIMECGGCEMTDYIEKKGGFLREADAREIFHQMLLAVKHCHDKFICHHDIKLENFLIDEATPSGTVKLIDFGFSLDMSGHSRNVLGGSQVSGRYSWCTPLYASKQLLFREDHHAEKTDAFALGVCLFYMLTGSFPPWTPSDDLVSSLKHNLLLSNSTSNGMTSLLDSPHSDTLSSEAKDLLLRMLAIDEPQRITISDALKHPWLLEHSYVTRIS